MSTGDMPRCGLCGAWLFPTDGPPHQCYAAPYTNFVPTVPKSDYAAIRELRAQRDHLLEAQQSGIWYSIKLQRMIEAARRNDVPLPYPELHHHKMLTHVMARLAEAERLLVEGTRFPMLTGERADWLIRARDWISPKRDAVSAPLDMVPAPDGSRILVVDDADEAQK